MIEIKKRNIMFLCYHQSTLTCHFIFIRHLSGQLLHGDVIKRAHNDDGPFEISCKTRNSGLLKLDWNYWNLIHLYIWTWRACVLETNLLWVGLSHKREISPEWWAAAGLHECGGRSFRSSCSLWALVVSRTRLLVLTPASPHCLAVPALFSPTSQLCGT